MYISFPIFQIHGFFFKTNLFAAGIILVFLRQPFPKTTPFAFRLRFFVGFFDPPCLLILSSCRRWCCHLIKQGTHIFQQPQVDQHGSTEFARSPPNKKPGKNDPLVKDHIAMAGISPHFSIGNTTLHFGFHFPASYVSWSRSVTREKHNNGRWMEFRWCSEMENEWILYVFHVNFQGV